MSKWLSLNAISVGMLSALQAGGRLEMRAQRVALVMAILLMTGKAEAGTAFSKAESGMSSQRILVSIPHRKLAVIRDGETLKTFSTAVGARSSPSPQGEFTVVNRLVRPTYYTPGKVIPAGPQNPLGTRWMGLSVKGFGIHGTNAPKSIGHAQSHGCIRLRNKDVEELFELVRVGDVVEVRGQADEATIALFGPVPGSKPAPRQMAAKPQARPAPALALGASLAGK